MKQNALIRMCLLLGVICVAASCRYDKPSSPKYEEVRLTPTEKDTLAAAQQYLAGIKNRLANQTPDGGIKFFLRNELRQHISALSYLPQVIVVVNTMDELNQISTTYYEVGYLRREYDYKSHTVGEGQTLPYLSERFGVSEYDLRRFNPNDIQGNTIREYLNAFNQDSLPTLVWYERKLEK